MRTIVLIPPCMEQRIREAGINVVSKEEAEALADTPGDTLYVAGELARLDSFEIIETGPSLIKLPPAPQWQNSRPYLKRKKGRS